MKTLRVTVQFCLLFFLIPIVAGVASASTLTLSGNLHFPSLDGSAQDSDGLADGTFTVEGDLVIEGTIHCNDDSPLPQSAGACPIRISVTGDLTLEAGSAIFAENRRGGGNGGDILLEVGGNLTLHGPDGALAGAIVSTSRPIGTAGAAGTLTVEVASAVDLEAGSILAASAQTGNAGAIEVQGETVRVAGLVASGPSRTVLSTALSGKALDGGSVGQAGGTIHLRALGSEEPGLRIDAGGLVVSQGEGGGTGLVLFEACGIEVRGLVASLSRNNPKDIGPSQVVLRSGKSILVDGRDLGSPAPAEGRFGRVRADGTQQGAAGYLVDLFAGLDIQVLGPDPGTAQGLFAVSSIPGDQPLRNAGGTITAIALNGALTGAGNAFETGRDVQGDKGGVIDLQARGDVTLDDATVRAVGGFTSNLSVNVRAGGHLDIRSFQGAVSWTFGVGDVRPTGTGVAAARRGTIEITACTTVDITGSQFPVLGSAVLPFPVETEGVCSPTAPSLPEGEPPLPTCGPANQPPAPSGGPFSIEENSAAGMVVGTVLANDPDPMQTHGFEITGGNTDGAFAIDDSGVITVANSAALDFEDEERRTFDLTVKATDNLGASGSGTVQIHLLNVNEAPIITEPVTCPNLNEGSAVGTNVCLVAFMEPDDGQSHTFSITNGNTGGAFAIDSSGQIVVASSSALNYEEIQTFTLTVQVTDSGLPPALSDTALVTIHLNDVNELPMPVLDTYSAFGNTQLVAGGLAGTHRAFSTDPDQVDTNDTDPDTLNPAFRNLAVVAGSGPTSKGGSYSVDVEGRFTYQPPVGYVTTTANPADPTGPDTFSYSLTDGTNTVPGVVQITVNHRIWYVHNNPGTEGNVGDSADPVDTLAEAETKSGAGDHIYVFQGDGSDTGMDAGITLKDGQKLVGERLDLVVAGTTLVDADGTRRPEISDSNDTISVLANTANGHRMGIEIRGLQLSSTGGNAIDLTSVDAANLEATVHDVVITATGGGQEGIDVNAGATGTTVISVSNASLTSAGNAFDARTSAAGNLRINFSNNPNILSNASGVVIDGSGGGVTTITGFSGNSVHPNTGGTGVSVTSATFDGTPGAPYNTIAAGAMAIGAPGVGNGVGGSGLVLINVQGDLSFTDLDIYADGGAGLQLSGTGPVNTAGGTGTRATVGGGVGIIEAIGGAAVDVSNATIDLQLTTLKSTNSTSRGVSLTNVSDGTTNAIFSAGSGSSITTTVGASGPAFNVSGGNAGITYAGTITSNGGRAVLVDSWSGDDAGDDLLFSGAIDENGAGILVNANAGSRAITFSGGMDIDTGANEGFAATSNSNSGGLHITGTNTVDTTTATALRVANTQIGSSGLTFRSIAAGTGSGSSGVGIVLDSTGTGVSNGGLTVTGNGSAGTGGTIQHKTGADGSTSAGIGIFLNNTKNVSLSWMQLNDFDNSAIAGRNVQGFTLQNSVINGTIGTTNVGSEGPIMFGLSNPSGVNGLQGTGLIRNTKISGGVEHNLEFYNQSGSMNLTIAGINAVSEGANPNSPADDVADCIIEENSVGLGGDGIQVEIQGTATASVLIDRCLFRDNKSQAVQVSALSNSSVTLTIDESRARRFDQGNEGFILQNGGDADLTAIVSNNHLNGFGGTAIFAGQVAGNATAASELNATISGNTIAQPATATNHAIITFLTSTVGQLSQARVLIDGNNVTNNSTSGTTRGIIVDTPDTNTTPMFHATVTNNTVSVGDSIAGVAGIVVQGRQSSDVCASIGNNSVTFPNGTPAGVFGLRARQTGSAIFDLEQSGSCTGTAAAVLACRNPGASTEVLGTLTVVPMGACLLPTTP